MGYETDFSGEFEITPPLEPIHTDYLKAFFHTRRMKRNAKLAADLPDPKRKAVNLPIGEEGCYYVGDEENHGQDLPRRDQSVIDHNQEPREQHGLWCPFEINDEGNLEIQCGKSYAYREWLGYVIEKFLKPWGYTLNGQVRYRGEEIDDMGVLTIINNKLNDRGLA